MTDNLCMDWRQLILDIQGCLHISVPKVAEIVSESYSVSCDKSTLYNILDAKVREPKHSTGEALKRLHAKVSKN
jgi:hypothetical protein